MSDVLHVVHPRAAGLDVHKRQSTATVRLGPKDGGEPQMHTGVFHALGVRKTTPTGSREAGLPCTPLPAWNAGTARVWSRRGD